jgi:hypothetical protein
MNPAIREATQRDAGSPLASTAMYALPSPDGSLDEQGEWTSSEAADVRSLTT